MVILFVVTNTLTIFMDYTNHNFKPFLDKFMMVFIDDILIYSRTMDKHSNHLRIVLSILREKQPCMSCQIVSFECLELDFLKHITYT